MPLLKINAVDDLPVLHGNNGLDDTLHDALQDVPADAPVVIMIHGYKFAPGQPGVCPHDHILSMTPVSNCSKAVSWPRHLGFGHGNQNEGLCIAFGWKARGTIWQAWRQAARAGLALADLVRRIQAHHACPVDIIAHSLGARVALMGITALPARAIGRVLLMTPAEYQSTAQTALASPAGQTAEFLNITSRENDLFDALTEWFIPAAHREDRALGNGLGEQATNWINIQVDCDQTRAALATLGHRIPSPPRRICHWSAYLRPGLFGFYRELIHNRHNLPLHKLHRELPNRLTPRWTRLRTADSWPSAARFLMPWRSTGNPTV